MPFPASSPGQRGAAMLEFAMLAVPLLLTGMIALEAARWFTLRQMLALALHEAARAGAVSHGNPRVLQDAFEQALHPLFVPAGPHGSPAARMRAASARLQARTGLQPYRIDILGPTAAAHADFAQPGLAAGGGPAISNDYLAEQHQRALEQGWPQGRGPASGLTIHEANVLHLRLVYLHAPLMPAVAALLRALPASPAGTYGARALAAGLLPVAVQVRMTMQSHPVLWRQGTERVGPAAADADSTSRLLPSAGWLFDGIGRAKAQGAGPGPRAPGDGAAQLPPPAGHGNGSEPMPALPGQGGQPSLPGHGEPPAASGPGDDMAGDPLCGVVLCCA